MKKRVITSVLTLLLTAATASAAPARGSWFRHIQKDGSVITVKLVGDEFNHYYLTEDGSAMDMSADGDLIPQSPTDYNTEFKRSITRTNVDKRRSTTRSASPIATPGKKKQLVILMEYPDKKFLATDPKEHWHNVFNTGYVEGKVINGSLHQYFLDQSEGIFDVDFDVYGPFTTKHERKFYGKNVLGEDQYADSLVIEACEAVKDIANLSDYDWNGDGEVEQVAVIYAGNGENDASAKDRNETIWPHQFYLSAYKPFKPYICDGITIDSYVVINDEFRGSTDGFGTFTHEYSHSLGLPDFYQTSGTAHNKDNFGDYDLMHSGCYNDGGWCPVNYTAHEKEYLGWTEAEELTAPASVSGMDAAANGGKAYKIRNNAKEATANEYYLLENRKKEGWDTHIPGGGLIITHYDYDQTAWFYNEVNNTSSHQRAVIIPACNDDKNDKGYPYPYNGNDCLTDDSTPAAMVCNQTTGGSKLMGKPITNISKDSNGLVSFDFMGGTSAIEDILPDSNAAELEYYDMQGRKVCPREGSIYIIRNKKTNKTYKSFNK